MPEFPDPTASAHPQGSARPHGEDAPTGDTPHAVAFLHQWAPQGPWLLSAIQPDTRQIITRTFHPDHEADATAFINSFQGKRNVYFSVNQPSHDLRIKAKKSDIAWAVALHVDIDPRAGHDLASERARILAALRAYEPEPSVIIDTGGGYSGFWRLLDPAPAALAADVEARNLHLAHELGGDHCHNIDRIMRLPGTLNLPDKVKQQKGRTISVARVVEAGWNRCYAPGDFEAADAKPAAPNGADDPDPGGPGDPSTLPDALRELIINGEPTVGHRSHVVWHVCCSLVRTGWSDAAIAAVLLDPAYRIGDHVRDQSNPAAYARKQAKKARDEVASDFDRDKRTGAIVQNDQRNIRLAVAKLGVSLSYNRFADRMLIEGPDDTPTRHLGDPEADALYLLIDEKFKFRPTRDFYRLVIDNAARRNTFHPVLDYLTGLTWDGISRIDTWLSVYGGADDTPYTRAVGRLTLVAGVRRIRHPGCKFDEITTLESDQGLEKSTALKILAGGDEWFDDNLPLNADSKVVIERLTGKWIIEFGDLHGKRSASIEHLKAFCSRTVDRARLAYGHFTSERQRQCIFFATTNEESYLLDHTGNRRFWPVRVERFDIPALTRDRDQLWAEAAHYEATGESIRLDPKFYQVASEQQENRRVPDPWEAVFEEALGDFCGRIRTDDLWIIVGMRESVRKQEDQARLGRSMQAIGWTKGPGRRRFERGGKKKYYYARGTGKELETNIFAARYDQGRLEIYTDDNSDVSQADEETAPPPKAEAGKWGSKGYRGQLEMQEISVTLEEPDALWRAPPPNDERG